MIQGGLCSKTKYRYLLSSGVEEEQIVGLALDELPNAKGSECVF